MRATSLFASLVLDGRVPGVPPVTLRPLLTTGGVGPVTLPVIYCQGPDCGSQLVTHWYAAGVEQGGPVRLLCLWCSRTEQGPVHTLVGSLGVAGQTAHPRG